METSCVDLNDKRFYNYVYIKKYDFFASAIIDSIVFILINIERINKQCSLMLQ